MVIHISKKNETSYIMMLMFFLYFIRQLPGISTLMFQGAVVVYVFIGLIVFFLNLAKKNINHKEKNILMLLYLIGVVCSVVNGNYSLYDYLNPLVYFGLTFQMLQQKLNVKLMYFNCRFYTIFFLGNMCIGTDPNNVFSVSQNNISIIMLFVVGLLYISIEQNNEKICIAPAVIMLVISLWAYGRSGIICSGLFCFFIVLEYMYERKKTISSYLKLLLLLICATITVHINSALIIFKLSRFYNHGVSDETRTQILSVYLEKCKDITNLLFGVQITSIDIIERYEYNMHNSYLALHSWYGLIGFSLVMGLIIYSYYRNCILKRYILIIILTVCLIRISTDIAAFVAILDPIIYYIALSSIKKGESGISVKQTGYDNKEMDKMKKY